MNFLGILSVCILVGCGADGPPTKPGLMDTGQVQLPPIDESEVSQ